MVARPVPLRTPRHHRQRGAAALLVATTLIAMVGLLGAVIDLGSLYVRMTELQAAADAAALAGARRMNRSPAGLDAAVHGPDGALAIAAANASDLGTLPVRLEEADISFSSSADGPWQPLASARAQAEQMRFIRVDTARLAQGQRPTAFMQAFGDAFARTTARAVAVAGAPICEGLPLFVCVPPSGNFTPGQSYFFGESPGYPVGPGNIGYFDPTPPGTTGMINGADAMREVICAGRTLCLAAPATFSSLTQNAFGTMARALNTRFDDFSGLPSELTPERCRPDTNIKEYRYTDMSPANKPLAWMSPAPNRQSEQDAGATLGVHWSAVRPEGAALAGVAALPTAKYPTTGTPYTAAPGSAFHTAPSAARRVHAQADRRIITLAMVSNCGSINGAGKPVQVVGFGRFFMPVRAVGTGSAKGIYVEFIERVDALHASAPDVALYR